MRAARGVACILFCLLVAATAGAQEVTFLEHDTINGTENSLLQVDADTYVLSYAGDGDDGFVKTFTIPADGSSITEVDSLEHDAVLGRHNSIVQVDADTYALAHQGDGFDGFVTTFTISADGSSITEVDSLEHDTLDARYNSFVQVDADTFALAYSRLTNRGVIRTFTISADGSSIAQAGSLDHETTLSSFNSLVQVDADTYALAYAGASSDGFIKTFSISADGATITEEQSLEHNMSEGTENSFVKVDADTFVLAHRGGGSDGYIKTFTIAADGSSITQVDELEHDTSSGGHNSLVHVAGDTFALAYASSLQGFMKLHRPSQRHADY